MSMLCWHSFTEFRSITDAVINIKKHPIYSDFIKHSNKKFSSFITPIINPFIMREGIPKGTRSCKELTIPEEVQIIGTIPKWLTGMLIRNGPAKWDLKNFTMNHLFDGYNLLTKFEIKVGQSGSGTVTFSSKFLQSESFKKAEAMQKPVISEYSTHAACTDAKKSVLARVLSTLIPQQSDNCHFICLTGMCENPLVIGDTGFMFELERDSLNCLSRHDPVKELGVHCQSSHTLVDSEGYTYNLGISIFSGARWNVLKFPPLGFNGNAKRMEDSIKGVKILTTFPCRNKTMIPWLHSFGMTRENFIVCIEQPSYFNVAKIVGTIFSKGFCPKDVNEWLPDEKNRFYLINKSTGKVIKTEILSKEAFFFYHVLNCYEEDGHVVCDVFCMPGFALVENQTISNLRSGYKASDSESPTLQRYVIPLIVSDVKTCPEKMNLVSLDASTATACVIDGKVILTPEILCNTFMEFATFNQRERGRSIRYLWASGAFAPSKYQNKIYKFDLHTRRLLCWEGKPYQFVGEPVFVPDPENTDDDCEDGGMVINVVTNMEDVEGEKDFILFLNAQNLTELGRAYFEADLPAALHGVFVSKDKQQ